MIRKHTTQSLASFKFFGDFFACCTIPILMNHQHRRPMSSSSSQWSLSSHVNSVLIEQSKWGRLVESFSSSNPFHQLTQLRILDIFSDEPLEFTLPCNRHHTSIPSPIDVDLRLPSTLTELHISLFTDPYISLHLTLTCNW